MIQNKLADLTAKYLLVSQCWQDPRMAKKHGMTVEKASKLLREVRALGHRPSGIGARLVQKAARLQDDIVRNQEGPTDAEMESGGK